MRVFKNHARASRSRSVATPTIAMLVLMVVGFALAFAGSARSATTINLGAAASFGALSATAMTNADASGPTVVSGDVGSPTSVGAGVTNPGFARYNGPADAAGMAGAQAAVTAAWISAGSQPTTGDVTGNLGGTKGPGVYDSSSAILINSALTLDGGGDQNAVFIFRAVSDLTVEVGASISYINGAQPCNVFWKVDSAWLKNSGSTFVGTILALTQITLTNNITVQGRLLARNADVTFIHDTVVRPSCAAAATTSTTPVPTTTAATTTSATTTAATTTTTSATTTTTSGTTTTAGTTPTGGTTTTPGTPASPGATTTTPAPNSPAAKAAATTAAKAAKKADAKAKKPIRGHAKPPRHRFGLTG
jgi:hypothetical protein